MTKEEFKRIQQETRVSAFRSSCDDPLESLIAEVFWAGYEEGYTHAAGLLSVIGPRLAGCRYTEYLQENMEKIHRRISAIHEMESSQKEEDSFGN